MQTNYAYNGSTPSEVWYPLKKLSFGQESSHHVNYFEQVHYMYTDDVKQITAFEGMYLPIGEVLMVRSTSVPEMGDHFIVISGPLEVKPHGNRPATISIATSPYGVQMLDLFEPRNGLTLLQLSSKMRDKFHAFHNAKVENGKIVCLISKSKENDTDKIF